MRTTDIVIRLHEWKEPIKLEIGNAENYSSFYEQLIMALQTQSADIVHKGDYFRFDQNLLSMDTDGYATFVLYREIAPVDDTDEALWEMLLEQTHRLQFPAIREHNAHHQLIELSSLDSLSSDGPLDFGQEAATEEILIRIPGSRDELEFDPAGAEGNAILYNKLVKLIYDREAEVMFKGPKLVFEENRDLFINADNFSVYVLFRARRSSNYEDNAMLWSHLESDLKTLSSITLLRSGEHYQVLLFTHDRQTASTNIIL